MDRLEVDNLQSVPEHMETLTIDPGRYLVVNFEGTIAAFVSFWQDFILIGYQIQNFEIDNRPSF